MISAGNISIELFAKINGKDIPVGTISIPLDVRLVKRRANDTDDLTAIVTIGKPAE
jgi:hypothetical protein